MTSPAAAAAHAKPGILVTGGAGHIGGITTVTVDAVVRYAGLKAVGGSVARRLNCHDTHVGGRAAAGAAQPG